MRKVYISKEGHLLQMLLPDRWYIVKGGWQRGAHDTAQLYGDVSLVFTAKKVGKLNETTS